MCAREWRPSLPRADKAQALLRALPGVDAVVTRVERHPALAGIPRRRLTEAAREVLAAERRRVLEGAAATAPADALADRVVARLSERGAFSLSRVINATGVVLHTNLGRALLSPLARERLQAVAGGYSNLEMDVARKERGSRYSHVDALLQRLTGAEASLVVNNCASAVLLVARDSRPREGGHRVARRADRDRRRVPHPGHHAALAARRCARSARPTAPISRTTPRRSGPIRGSCSRSTRPTTASWGSLPPCPLASSAELGRERGVPVMEDLGSGCLIDLRRYGFPYEPTVPEVVASGVDLVSFSGDKLLGGPQAGIVVGKSELIGRLAKNPLNRALRIDKLTVAALEATLYAYEAGDALGTIPTLRMLTETQASIRRRARGLLRRLSPETHARLGVALVDATSQVGGGALPTVELPTSAVALGTPAQPAHALDERLRLGHPPVLGRVLDDRLLLDFRTILPADIPALASALGSL